MSWDRPPGNAPSGNSWSRSWLTSTPGSAWLAFIGGGPVGKSRRSSATRRSAADLRRRDMVERPRSGQRAEPIGAVARELVISRPQPGPASQDIPGRDADRAQRPVEQRGVAAVDRVEQLGRPVAPAVRATALVLGD